MAAILLKPVDEQFEEFCQSQKHVADAFQQFWLGIGWTLRLIFLRIGFDAMTIGADDDNQVINLLSCHMFQFHALPSPMSAARADRVVGT
jgi:hypothetical protein